MESRCLTTAKTFPADGGLTGWARNFREHAVAMAHGEPPMSPEELDARFTDRFQEVTVHAASRPERLDAEMFAALRVAWRDLDRGRRRPGTLRARRAPHGSPRARERRAACRRASTARDDGGSDDGPSDPELKRAWEAARSLAAAAQLALQLIAEKARA